MWNMDPGSKTRFKLNQKNQHLCLWPSSLTFRLFDEVHLFAVFFISQTFSIYLKHFLEIVLKFIAEYETLP